MIYVVNVANQNKQTFSRKKCKKVTVKKKKVVRQMFSGLKICAWYLFRRLRLLNQKHLKLLMLQP